eukprot:GHVO01067358.1.p1 GENE.GHVO01067358.1~~GHVO01067358.1.p1  ORF type:complete len:130 (+),score=22.41 GHVO01067358.1:76-465(+)
MPEVGNEILHCKVVKATDLYKTEHFSRADPYVVIKLGDNKAKTKTKREAGRNPTFDEDFEFGYKGENQIMFYVYDEESAQTDKIIGFGDLNIQSAAKFSGEVELKRTKDGSPIPAGKLTVDLCVKPGNL